MPGHSSAYRRRRRQRVLARELAERFGPDQAEVMYSFSDGWTIRRVLRLEDQIREGELMHNCMRHLVKVPCVNCYSLRDPENLPRATFAIWSLASLSLPRRLRGEIDEDPSLLLAGRCLFQLDYSQPLRRPEYVDRLLHVGNLSVVDAALTLPLDPFEREWMFAAERNPATTDLRQDSDRARAVFALLAELRDTKPVVIAEP